MFGIYDDLTPDHVPGLQKYDMCMTEQLPGPQGVKIVGRHMPSAPKGLSTMYYVCINLRQGYAYATVGASKTFIRYDEYTLEQKNNI